jgi:hypothetical protein
MRLSAPKTGLRRESKEFFNRLERFGDGGDKTKLTFPVRLTLRLSQDEALGRGSRCVAPTVIVSSPGWLALCSPPKIGHVAYIKIATRQTRLLHTQPHTSPCRGDTKGEENDKDLDRG